MMRSWLKISSMKCSLSVKSLPARAEKVKVTLTSQMNAARRRTQNLAARPLPRELFDRCEMPRTKPDKQTNPIAPSTHTQICSRLATNPEARCPDAMLRMKYPRSTSIAI